jgi:hypothetical protein
MFLEMSGDRSGLQTAHETGFAQLLPDLIFCKTFSERELLVEQRDGYAPECFARKSA